MGDSFFIVYVKDQCYLKWNMRFVEPPAPRNSVVPFGPIWGGLKTKLQRLFKDGG